MQEKTYKVVRKDKEQQENKPEMEPEYTFNSDSQSQSKPLEKQPYAAFVVKGDPEEIAKLKEHILEETTLRLIYQHRDSRYLKVSPATEKDNF